MSTPTPQALKQQKIFAGIQIAGGIASAVVAGYSFVSNVLAGAPVEGSLLALGALTIASIVYAFYFTIKLGRIAEASQSSSRSSS